MPFSMGILTIFYPVANRPLILCQQCVSTGENYTYFHVGYFNNSSKSIVWYSVHNGSMVTSIARGGTGANTAEQALINLGAAKSADIGDVTTLVTTDKTVVGAINEMQAGIGDVETALTAIIGGAG
jgi:phage-related tail fiber protein